MEALEDQDGQIYRRLQLAVEHGIWELEVQVVMVGVAEMELILLELEFGQHQYGFDVLVAAREEALSSMLQCAVG